MLAYIITAQIPLGKTETIIMEMTFGWRELRGIKECNPDKDILWIHWLLFPFLEVKNESGSECLEFFNLTSLRQLKRLVTLREAKVIAQLLISSFLSAVRVENGRS